MKQYLLLTTLIQILPSGSSECSIAYLKIRKLQGQHIVCHTRTAQEIGHATEIQLFKFSPAHAKDKNIGKKQ